ncbi:MAG: hypothetical protein IPH75_05220 [bacterium]|nr:hypothetical protein [bacterium]
MNTRDSLYPDYWNGGLAVDTILDVWIEVDSLVLTSDSSNFRSVVVVDTTLLSKYPGGYRLGTHFPFSSILIPPEINEIQVSFDARLHSKEAGIVEKKPFAFHMFRFSEKRPGPYVWNRCN